MSVDVELGQQFWTEVWDTMAAVQKQAEVMVMAEQAAGKRAEALAKVHQQGWATLAATVGQGLAQIAEAIRHLEVAD